MSLPPPIAVIAGGLGTRLHPITQTIPKSLVSVGGEAFIDHQLRLFARKGLRKAIYCVGHLGEQIERHLALKGTQGVEVLFSHDGDILRGTGGALRNAVPLLGDEFLVTYGDSYLDVDYGAVINIFRASAQPALMTVYRNDGAWDTSNVEFLDNKITSYNKKNRTPSMRHIDYGLLGMHRTCFDGWRAPLAFDLADLLTPLAEDGKLAGIEVGQRFYEAGSQRGIEDLENYLTSLR